MRAPPHSALPAGPLPPRRRARGLRGRAPRVPRAASMLGLRSLCQTRFHAGRRPGAVLWACAPATSALTCARVSTRCSMDAASQTRRLTHRVRNAQWTGPCSSVFAQRTSPSIPALPRWPARGNARPAPQRPPGWWHCKSDPSQWLACLEGRAPTSCCPDLALLEDVRCRRACGPGQVTTAACGCPTLQA